MKAKKGRIKKLIAFSVIILILAAVILTALHYSRRSLLKTLYPRQYADIVEVYCKEYNLSENFIFAVIKCESDFEKDAVSYTGAVGLMQIMPDTFEWINMKLGDSLTFDQATDPQVSVRFGCYLYSYLLEKFGSEELAIAAYHAGIGSVQKWLADEKYSADGKSLHTIPFPTTEKYVKNVIKTKNIYHELYHGKDG